MCTTHYCDRGCKACGIGKRSGSYRALELLFCLSRPCRLGRTCCVLKRLAGAGCFTASGDLENIPRSHKLTLVCHRRLCARNGARRRRRCALSLFHSDHEPATVCFCLALQFHIVWCLFSLLCGTQRRLPPLQHSCYWASSPAHVYSPAATVACPRPGTVTFLEDVHLCINASRLTTPGCVIYDLGQLAWTMGATPVTR